MGMGVLRFLLTKDAQCPDTDFSAYASSFAVCFSSCIVHPITAAAPVAPPWCNSQPAWQYLHNRTPIHDKTIVAVPQAMARSANSWCAVAAVVLLQCALLAQQSDAHAVMIDPKSRPWYDYMDNYNYNPHAVFAGGACEWNS